MDTNKKISFGFNKLAKKPTIVRSQPVEEKKVELVECLEGQSIKIKDAVEIVEEPLVIPIQDNNKNLLDRVKEAKAKRGLTKQEEDNRPDSELTIEELAARALISDAKQRLENNIVTSSKVTVLPVKEDKFLNEGEKEPTLEDYENIPISDYGMAMLRGMGWKEGTGIGKDPTKTAAVSAPELRPKGLGLGATRIIKTEEPACDRDGNTLILKRGAYAKVIAGLHKGNYCEVQGLDDEAGRVIVKTSLKGDVLTLNEFLIVPVTKEEFSRCAKVLNNAKYEEYKEISDRKLDTYRKVKSKVSDSHSDNESKEESNFKSSEYNKQQKDNSSLQKTENLNEFRSSDNDNDVSSDQKMQRSGESSTYKNKNRKDDRDKKYNNKYKCESHSSKSKDKKMSDSDCDDKYERSRNKLRDSSDSDTGQRRKKKSKDKKSKKDRDRSRSRKEKQSNHKSSHSKNRTNRSRSPSYDHKERSNKKHKLKSRHRQRSRSNSSDERYRRSRK